MKHMTIAVVILTIIATGSIFCVNYTQKISEQLLDTLDICEEAVDHGNWDAAQKNIYLTGSLWEKYRPRLAIFLMHSDLNEISDALIQVTAWITLQDKTQFFAETRRLTALVDEISKLDSVTFENIF